MLLVKLKIRWADWVQLLQCRREIGVVGDPRGPQLPGAWWSLPTPHGFATSHNSKRSASAHSGNAIQFYKGFCHNMSGLWGEANWINCTVWADDYMEGCVVPSTDLSVTVILLTWKSTGTYPFPPALSRMHNSRCWRRNYSSTSVNYGVPGNGPHKQTPANPLAAQVRS